MEKSVGIFRFKHEISEQERSLLSTLGADDICFYRFVGGNAVETKRLIEELSSLKDRKALLLGLFRFPYKFEGKKRLQTAITQYHYMKEMCDAVLYFNSEGMLDILKPGTPIQQANETFHLIEDAPIKALEEMISKPGEMNIDVQDIQVFIKKYNGPLFLHSFEGESFDEPLKYAISTPYLPQDFADGEQLIINIGYSREVDMDAFRQINLRLNDLFHKADLFKIGTYFIDEPGHRFKITVMVNGLQDPYERPKEINRISSQRQWLKRKWTALVKKGKETKWIPPAWKQGEETLRKSASTKGDGLQL